MRITFLMPSDTLTGGTRVIAVYAGKLAERGHDVLVVNCAPSRLTFREKARAIRKGDWQRLKNAMAPPPGHIALSGVARKVLDRPRPIHPSDVPDADIIIATWWETANWMHAMPANKGRKVHLIQGYETWPRPETTEAVHRALMLPNAKIAISSNLKQTIEGRLGNLGITVIPNAVDPGQFNAEIRTKQPKPTVGFVYAVNPIKGSDICIRACELAKQHLPGLRVIAFGAERISGDLPLPSGSEFFYRPTHEVIRQIYSRCDAWLFGSRLDSFGLPILEAMACRTPVVAVPVGAAPDLLADGSGTLVAMESPGEMAAAIATICNQTECDWMACSERAYRKAHAYSWDDATTRLLEILES